MNKLELLKIATMQAMVASKNEFPNEVIYLYYSKELTEFTLAPENSIARVLEIEPNLELIAKYLNGEKVN